MYGRKINPSLPGATLWASFDNCSTDCSPFKIFCCSQATLAPDATMAPKRSCLPAIACSIATKASLKLFPSVGIKSTVEVPVISATTPGSITPASRAAEQPSTEPK